MIIALILTPIFLLINSLISLLPQMEGLPSWVNDLATVIGYALNVVPVDVWVISIANIMFWNFGLIGWSIIEWIYKKIPGVD